MNEVSIDSLLSRQAHHQYVDYDDHGRMPTEIFGDSNGGYLPGIQTNHPIDQIDILLELDKHLSLYVHYKAQ